MTTEQKRNEIEESYLNGQKSKCAEQFRKCRKSERKQILSDIVGCMYYQEGANKDFTLKLSMFLIESL